MNNLSTNEFIISLIFFLIIIICGWIIKIRNQEKHPEYKYFLKGLIFKLLGVIVFCLVYIYYYKGGDTLAYFKGSKALGNLLLYDFDRGLDVFLNFDTPNNSIYSFNTTTGFPPKYMWKDPNTFSVCRFASIFAIIGFNSFFTISFFTAVFSFVGIWKLYRLFNDLYPGNSRVFAYLIIFMPSLLFWGSGIMKDSFVLGATCWISYNFYQILIARKKIITNLLFFMLNLYLILNTKSYVIISLIPGMLLWLNSTYLNNTKGVFKKLILIPFLIIIITGLGYFSISNLSELMGVYGDVDTAIEKAQIIQADLLRDEQYGSNNYDLGELDGSVGGMLAVAPLAIFTALYRPLFWEIGSPLMAISVIENSILIFFTLIILIRINVLRLIRIILNEPILIYAFVFSILFAFGVGIAGTNFGALVRYKIPLLPFYFPMLFLTYKLSRVT